MKSGIIYIKRRITSGKGYESWHVVKEKLYASVPQRIALIKSLSQRYQVNNVNIVISVIPRDIQN